MATELREWIGAKSSRLSLHSTEISEQATSTAPKFKFKSGWRFGLFAGAASCIVVFIVNLFAAIWAMTRDEKNRLDQPVLREGACSEMKYLNTGLHLIINALSSILLAASNYGMQCITAPTRADVDKAHFEGKWLDIGVPSVHNLSRLPAQRVVLWGLLMLSSLPLHLVYNSVVFSSLGAFGYDIWTVQSTNHSLSQSEFFDRPWNVSADEYIRDTSPMWTNPNWTELKMLGVSGKLKKLTNLECIRQYASSLQTSHRSVILVMAPKPDTSFLQNNAYWEDQINIDASTLPYAYDWICGRYPCQVYEPPGEACHDKLPSLEKGADDWSPYCDKVKFCYSQPIEETCQVTFSPAFIAFVLVSNALKAAVLLYIALRPPEESLFVLGDAIESFLTVPDAFSADSCLASVQDIRRRGNEGWTAPRTWTPVKRRWAAAISRRRWKVSILLYSISLSVVLSFLVLGIVSLDGSKDLGTLWRLGFGTVTELTLIQTAGRGIAQSFTMTESVLLANLPHFVFSGLYFQYNALFTGMLAAKEWSDFGRKRKGLRVSSDPRGDQRSRYFLQLPYRWSIPLILMSMLIHWMLSQSIFLVPIELEDEFATTCGYSPVAIFAVIIAAVAMALAVVITGYRRLPTSMPVVGSCSLVIAAACHGLGGAERSDEPLVPLRWGAMTHPDESSGDAGHCGFSGDYVDEPYEGCLYS
ncbi:hypothetical protein NCS52_01205800 [Fusarium sp. LHS14.1]|nr:hypothetical protein NCS52_01205800 [Fusarium sp. LHS14.1]